MSNWMGLSGATRASSESTERAGDGSEPTELMLPARPARPLLDRTWRKGERKSEGGVAGGGGDERQAFSEHGPAGSHALVPLLEGRRRRHGLQRRLVDSGGDLLQRASHCDQRRISEDFIFISFILYQWFSTGGSLRTHISFPL